MADRFVSADDHVQEHPRVWTDRLSAGRWGERIPHLQDEPDGTQRWMVDERPLDLPGVALAAALLPDRTQEPRRWEEVPAPAFDPAARLRAMDADGVDVSVLYPTVAGMTGETFARLDDPELELACVQAYNDWLLEEWVAMSDRFVPQCILPLAPAEAAAEVQRAVAKGHRGVVYPAVPMDLREVPHINGPEYDVLWAALQDAGVPICFHASSSSRGQMNVWEGYAPELVEALRAVTRPVSTVVPLVNALISRILFRFPQLKVVFAESGIAWAAYMLEYTDHQFEKDRLLGNGYDLKPAELFRRQCYLTAWYESTSMAVSRFIGTGNILWSTQFPLATSTWPDTAEKVARWAPTLSEEERGRILWRNAADLYGLRSP